MKKIQLAAHVAVLVSCLHVQAATAATKDRYVVVLSLDGLRWDYPSRANTPTLDSLRRVGTYSETCPCFPYNTFPNHYSMATGLHPDHHGIVNNTFYDKALGKWFSIGDEQSVRDPDFWRGEPIWNTAERQGVRTPAFMWVGCHAATGVRQASRVVPYDGKVGFGERANWVLEEMNRSEDSIPRLIMWYIEEPDHTSHGRSPDSPETMAVVERLDCLPGWFSREARRSPVFEKTDFIVTSDHGMASLAPDRYINLYPLPDAGRVKYAINGNPLYIESEPYYVDEAYEIISRRPNLEVFRREAMPVAYHYGNDTMRITRLVVLPRMVWMAACRKDERLPGGGNHGFDPFGRDMHTVFYASEPDFRKGYEQPPFQNLNLHAVIACLPGIKPADGNDCDLAPLQDMFVQ